MALPRDFYLDQDQYATIIQAYKEFMMSTAKVITREIHENVDDAAIMQGVQSVIDFETQLAAVSFGVL